VVLPLLEKDPPVTPNPTLNLDPVLDLDAVCGPHDMVRGGGITTVRTQIGSNRCFVGRQQFH
jgi:hypothetical protein